ncbi:MAG: response regulator transcription factor [Maritimibacter sp.]|jgi:two-component system, OmpR family, response regulator
MSHIIVVEDEQALRIDLIDYLMAHGYEVTGAASAAELRAALADRSKSAPELIILDIGLPDGNGFDLAEEIRQGWSGGIIMLTAFGATEDRIRGFHSGADIYLVKHAPLREILAATQSLLRRVQNTAKALTTAQSDHWSLNSADWMLHAPDGTEIALTATEYGFLQALSECLGAPCLRADLVQRLARPQTDWNDRHLDAVVSRLRRKVASQTTIPLPVRMVYGKGYAFTAELQQSNAPGL